MKKSWLIIGGIVFLILILFFWWRSAYNGFVTKEENIKAQLGQLNNVYQQRLDLIPNLVATVQGSAVAERQTLTDVISARSKATGVTLTPEALKDPQAFANFQKLQDNVSSALSRLLVTIEKYPDLKSQANFSTLMSQIEGQESRVRIERNRYNENVNEYNRSIRVFPSSIIAGMSGFTAYQYFQAAQGAENAPKVSFPGSEAAPPSGAAPEQPATAPEKGPARPSGK
ncbi:MAG: LemA family protein [Ignavibacteriota bacterium]